jgi:hypothetical protein
MSRTITPAWNIGHQAGPLRWSRFVDADTQPSTPATEPKADDTLGENGLKALQAERDARKAAEKALADAQSTWESERATLSQTITEKENEAGKAVLEAARVRVFRDKGIPKELEKFVQGSSAEEFETSADEVLAAFRPAPSDPSAQERRLPKPDPTQGASEDASKTASIDEQIAAAERDGKRDVVMALKAQKLGQIKTQ